MYNGNWHLAAFRQSIAQNSFLQIAALADPYLPFSGSGFLPNLDLKLWCAFALGATMNRAKIQNADLLAVNPLNIRPINLGATPLSDPELFELLPNPVLLSGQEEFDAFANQTSAGAEIETVLTWLSPGLPKPIAQSPIYVIRATSTTAAVSGAWSQIAYALDQGLPAGEYAIIMSNVISANAIAHRWIFDDSGLRPGFLSSALETDKISRYLKEYRLGEAGRFVTYSLPRLEVLAGGADASHTIYIWIQRTRQGTVG